MPSRTARRFVGALLVPLALFLAGCGADYPQNTLDPVGSVAKEQAALFKLTFGIATVIFFLVEG